jgi:hypothetical protein
VPGAVAIPEPKPQDVNAPVPAPRDAGPSPEDVQNPRMFMSAASGKLQAQDEMQNAPATASDAQTPDALNSALAKLGSMQAPVEGADTQGNPALESALSKLSGATSDAGDGGAGTKGLDALASQAPAISRVVANLGRSPNERRDLLQKSLGPDYETRVVGDAVQFRKRGEGEFHDMEPGFFESLKGVLKNVGSKPYSPAAQAAMGVLGELVSRYSGSLLEAGVNAGTAATVAAGGAAAGGPAGGVAGLIAGEAAAGATSAAARDAAIRAMGVTPEFDVRREAALNALTNVATLGAGVALKTPIKLLTEKVGEALGQTVGSRLRQLAKIREGVEGIRNEFQLAEPPNAALGKQITSALDVLESRMGSQIGVVEDKAVALAGKQRFPLDSFKAKMQEILEKNGATIGANGTVELPNDLAAVKPFGVREGGLALRRIAADYNALVRGGGYDIQTMLNTLSYYKKPAGFDKALPNEVNNVFQDLRKSLRLERDALFTQVLKGTPEGDFATSAYRQFSQNIDEIRDFQKLALSKGSPEKFAEALISPKDSAGVLQLKQVFGPASQEFDAIRSSWFNGVLERSIDPDSGIVGGALLKKELKKYGPDVVSELLSPTQQNALRVLADRADKVAFVDLVKNPEQSAFVNSFVRASTEGNFVSGKVRFLLNVFRSNKEVLDYLSRDGLLKLAKETPDPLGKTQWVRSAEWLRKILDVSEVEIARDGRKRVVLPLETSAIATIINASERGEDEDEQAFLSRRKKTLDSLRKDNGR